MLSLMDTQDELHKFVGSVLRFVPVEVAARYYGTPLLCKGSAAYANPSHDTGRLGDQGYEHHFEAAVLFSPARTAETSWLTRAM